jgi:hypothetical protein
MGVSRIPRVVRTGARARGPVVTRIFASPRWSRATRRRLGFAATSAQVVLWLQAMTAISDRAWVVVLGATGFTGRLVCRALRRRNVPFAIAGRNARKLALLTASD